MRSRWSEVADEVTPRTREEDERARALARLAEGPVAWVSLPRGLPERLIEDGEAEQDGIAYLRAKEKRHG